MTCPLCQSYSTTAAEGSPKKNVEILGTFYACFSHLLSLPCPLTISFSSSLGLLSLLSFLPLYFCPLLTLSLPLHSASLCSKWNQIWLWVSGSLSASLSVYSALVFWPHCQRAVLQHTHTYTQPYTLQHTPTPIQYSLEHVVYVQKFDAPLYNVIPMLYIYAYFWENKIFSFHWVLHKIIFYCYL